MAELAISALFHRRPGQQTILWDCTVTAMVMVGKTGRRLALAVLSVLSGVPYSRTFCFIVLILHSPSQNRMISE